MSVIYSMSDIHGMLRPFRKRLEQLNLDEIRSGEAMLILLGDYIDRGMDSLGALQTIYDLQQDVGENVIALLGNHDNWFIQFMNGDNPYWIGNFKSMSFVSQFVSDDELGRINHLLSRYQLHLTHDIVRHAFEREHKHLYTWLKGLPLYFETERQIYVHAGIDEEAEDLWAVGTSDEMFIEKYPPEKGYFYKDIIAGHVSVSTASGSLRNHDIYFDRKSHFYIDGVDSYPLDVKEDKIFIPLLKYEEEEGIGRYYSISTTGMKRLLCEKTWD